MGTHLVLWPVTLAACLQPLLQGLPPTKAALLRHLTSSLCAWQDAAHTLDDTALPDGCQGWQPHGGQVQQVKCVAALLTELLVPFVR